MRVFDPLAQDASEKCATAGVIQSSDRTILQWLSDIMALRQVHSQVEIEKGEVSGRVGVCDTLCWVENNAGL